ncbi:MAG: alpha/beta hydrolase [Candidatus Omnitrophica bacterium]|nr:alpha/beta hydrolase [Candidatus Omnitrophota bacterium]
MILLIIILGVIIFKVFFIFLEQKSLYHPYKDIPETPKNLGIAHEDVNFKTADGKLLNGWFVPANDAGLTLLYCHGNAGNMYHRLHKVKFFHEMGVNFFIFDYRGYGKSTGRPSESGLSKDAQAAYDYLISRNDVDKNKIVVYGKSLGGPIAADLCNRRQACALILEGSFATVALRAQQLYPFLPMKFLITQKYDTVAKVNNLRIPKLIVHGRADAVINFQHGEVLFSAAPEPKQFLPFEGGHNDDLFVISRAYKDQLEIFFAKYVTHVASL